MNRLLVPLGLLLLLGAGVPADESQLKPDAQTLEARFKVMPGRFDGAKRTYIWVLEAKESSSDPCHYEAAFLDADDREVTTAKLEFEDGGRGTEQGAKNRAWVKYPTKKTMEKVARILIRKSDC